MEEDKGRCTNSCALLSLDEAKNTGLGLLQVVSFFFFQKIAQPKKSVRVGWFTDFRPVRKVQWRFLKCRFFKGNRMGHLAILSSTGRTGRSSLIFRTMVIVVVNHVIFSQYFEDLF